jgi:hypothetical protein
VPELRDWTVVDTRVVVERWSMRGAIFGGCNCDFGCPCNFNVPPTDGHCDGVYVFFVRDGHYGDLPLDGLHFAWAGSFPGPLHEGNGKGLLIVDERTTANQREALETLWRSGHAGLPFDILGSITATWYPTLFAPFDVDLAGIDTRARIGVDGAIYDLVQSRARNPVTGEEEEIYLDKPTGFTSKRSELGMAPVSRFSGGELAWDTSGKYAEYAEFEYAGP